MSVDCGRAWLFRSLRSGSSWLALMPASLTPAQKTYARLHRILRPALHGGVRGFTPAMWCAERLPANVRIVTIEEVAWRKRMLRDAELTMHLMRKFEATK